MDDAKIKYLEMIQGVINRMAANSFSLKGWGVTLATGIFAIAASKDANVLLLTVAYIPVLLFWFLDSYYLQQERKFRLVYKNAVKTDPKDIVFNLAPPKKGNWKEKTCFIQSLYSRTEMWFYVPFAILIAIIQIFVF